MRHDSEWEENSAATMKHLWMAACESPHSYLTNPAAAGTEDKRLEIDLEGLREYLWEYPDGTLKDYIHEDQHDPIRWIDTSTMICDPLTKSGPKGFAQRLIDCISSGDLSLEPTVESQMRKLQQQKRRKVKALEKQSAAQDETQQDGEVNPSQDNQHRNDLG